MRRGRWDAIGVPAAFATARCTPEDENEIEASQVKKINRHHMSQRRRFRPTDDETELAH
jgi:hypothetical protein